MKQFQIIYKKKGSGKEIAFVEAETRKAARAYFWETLSIEEKNKEIELIDVEEVE